MQPDKLVKIIIPIYTTTLKQEEWSSIDRCFSLLGKKYEIAFAIPEGLDIELLHRRYQNFSVHPFTPSFFKGLEGYNQMMLSPEFYKSFLDYEYILIYQTDAYVFKDDLSAWCLKGYDYIGAPWIPKKKYIITYSEHLIIPVFFIK